MKFALVYTAVVSLYEFLHLPTTFSLLVLSHTTVTVLAVTPVMKRLEDVQK
jgi:hypothetical protein